MRQRWSWATGEVAGWTNRVGHSYQSRQRKHVVACRARGFHPRQDENREVLARVPRLVWRRFRASVQGTEIPDHIEIYSNSGWVGRIARRRTRSGKVLVGHRPGAQCRAARPSTMRARGLPSRASGYRVWPKSLDLVGCSGCGSTCQPRLQKRSGAATERPASWKNKFQRQR